MVNGQIGKVYDVYVPESSVNIQAADEVVIASKRYTVRAKEVVDFGGVPYVALVCVLEDA